MEERKNTQPGDMRRREFAAFSVAAGLAATAGSSAAADMDVVETDVEIKTPDGTCDAAFIHPKTGSHAGVLVWPDAFGLRPAMRENRQTDGGRRIFGPGAQSFLSRGQGAILDCLQLQLSESGRHGEAAAVDGVGDRARQRREGCRRLCGLPGRAERSGQSEEDRNAGLLHGRTAGGEDRATLPDRIGAGASFHGGGLVTDKPDSPHLLAPKIKAPMYFGIAANDDARQPDAKDKLKRSFRSREGSRGDRSLRRGAARLVRAGHADAERRADLQQAGRGEGLGKTGGVI